MQKIQDMFLIFRIESLVELRIDKLSNIEGWPSGGERNQSQLGAPSIL